MEVTFCDVTFKRYRLSDWQMTKANVSKRRSIVRAALSYLMHASLKNCYTALKGPRFQVRLENNLPNYHLEKFLLFMKRLNKSLTKAINQKT